MDGEEEETEDEECVSPIDARRARGLDFLLAPVILLHDLAEAVENFTDYLASILAGHANYLTERRNFGDEVRLELENLPTTEE